MPFPSTSPLTFSCISFFYPYVSHNYQQSLFFLHKDISFYKLHVLLYLTHLQRHAFPSPSFSSSTYGFSTIAFFMEVHPFLHFPILSSVSNLSSPFPSHPFPTIFLPSSSLPQLPWLLLIFFSSSHFFLQRILHDFSLSFFSLLFHIFLFLHDTPFLSHGTYQTSLNTFSFSFSQQQPFLPYHTSCSSKQKNKLSLVALYASSSVFSRPFSLTTFLFM